MCVLRTINYTTHYKLSKMRKNDSKHVSRFIGELTVCRLSNVKYLTYATSVFPVV